LSRIWFWPGICDGGQVPLEDPSAAAFVAAADPVCNVYSSALKAQAVPHRISEVRMFVHGQRDQDAGRIAVPAGKADDEVLVLVYVDPRPDGFEMAVVYVPDGLQRLRSPTVTLLALEVIDAVMRRFASAWSCPTSALDTALDEARSSIADSVSLDSSGVSGFKVRAEGRGVTAPDQPPEIIVFLASSDPASHTRDYRAGLIAWLEVFQEDAASWWADADQKILAIESRDWGGGPRYAVRVRPNEVKATIHRLPVDIDAGGAGRQQALEDCQEILSRVVTKTGLNPPPTLDTARLMNRISALTSSMTD
jgi:hypothetical protein